MSWKEEYDIPLDPEGINLARTVMVFDKGLADVTVIYCTYEGGESIPLVTYDTSHGFPHRDIRYLDEKDKRKKREIPAKDLEEFYQIAIEDIVNNWRRYFREYKETQR